MKNSHECSQRSTFRRTAISLVEVLVVISILFVLSALMLTALQSARESARTSSCKNRLRQLCIAAQQYEVANSHFPPGILGVREAFQYRGNYHHTSSPLCWRHYQYTSFLGLTLPYLEEDSLYSEVDPAMFDVRGTLENVTKSTGTTHHSSFLDVASAVKLGEHEIPAFLCPSDTLTKSGQLGVAYVMGAIQPVVSGSALADRLAWINLKERHPANFAQTSYVGCLGAHSGGHYSDEAMNRFSGIMSSRALIRVRDCKDGLSATLCIGETCGEIQDGRRTIVNSWLWGAVARGRGNVAWLTVPAELPLLGDWQSASFVGFGSFHPAGVHCAFADGHALAIDKNVDWSAWYRYCAKSDEGVMIPFDSESLDQADALNY